MMRELVPPRRPIVRNVVPPQVELAANPLRLEQPGQPARALERSGRVLPLALSAHEQDADVPAQPVQVISLQVCDVIQRIVEEGILASLAPTVAGGWVVVARHADRERENVGALEREVRGMESAEAAPARNHLAGATAVVTDEWDDLVEDPRLVDPVTARTLLDGDAGIRPRLGIERVDAVELRSAGLEQVADRADHPTTLELARIPFLRREREDRSPPMPVGRDAVHRGDQSSASSRVRCGSNASRQLV